MMLLRSLPQSPPLPRGSVALPSRGGLKKTLVLTRPPKRDNSSPCLALGGAFVLERYGETRCASVHFDDEEL